MEGKRERPQKRPRPALPKLPGKRKIISKQARIERQKALAETFNNSPEWFGAARDTTPGQSLEDRFESFTSLESKTEQPKAQVSGRSSTFTGFRELPIIDVLVILGLWFLRFFVPWVEAWHEFNLHLLIDPSHYAQLEKYFTFHKIIVFVVKCLICLAISLLVDFINFKYPTYFILLLLYISAPIVGVVVIILLGARGYDRPFYFEWWHKAVVMMMWAMSVPFVTFPLQFSCIFNQQQDMSRLAHYNWTAIFSLLEAVNACFAYWMIPPNCPTTWFKLIAVWGAIGVLLLVLIIEVLSLMRCAKPRITQLNSPVCKKNTTNPTHGTDSTAEHSGTPNVSDVVTKVLTKPSRIEEPKPANAPPKDLMMKKLLLFSLMLLPVIFTSFVFEILKRTRPEEDWDKHNSVTGTSMLASGQSIGAVVVVTVLFVIRKWTKLHRIPLLQPDVLALGFPLSINAVALIVILARFVMLSGLSEGDVILGPIPTNEVSIIEFYNVEFRNRTICVHSEYFGPLKVPPRQRATSVLEDPGEAMITFNVTVNPRTTPPVVSTGSFKYQKGVWVTYVVTLPASQLGGTDIEAFYSELQLTRVNGTDNIRPKKEPQIVFFNTYVVFVDGWYYNVTHRGAVESINQTHTGIAIQRSYTPDRLTITYWTEWIKLVQRGSHPPITIPLTIENYCVYSVVLCLSNIMKHAWNYSELVPRMLIPFKTMEIAGPNSKRLPNKDELEKDWPIIIGMTMAGMAKGGVYIGYLYLFWLDYPLSRFRTTFLAGFWTLMSLPGELASIKVIDIDVTQVIVLLVLQILFTILHFGTARFLYTPQFNFRDRPD